jgi:HlyD family secretion protein
MTQRRLYALIGTALLATTTVVGAFKLRGGEAAPSVTAEPVTRGDVLSQIAATGTLEAVTTVEVGSQVSGSIKSLHADFNDIVRKGQVLARLDPALFQSAIEQASANMESARANEERTAIALADAEVRQARARELAGRQLISQVEAETAEVTTRSAAAQVKAAAAATAQARASLNQAQVNMAKTVITSPIDGIVIARNVDVGQTVAASLSAPTLFVLAADLSQMQVKTNIDESDLGRIAAGQTVQFTVDAYPNQTFTGTVRQVRLNPVVESNVVTYAAIIAAANPRLELKPGMTANVTVEVSRREGVLRVPAAALRFSPTPQVLAALDSSAAPPVRGGRVWQYADGRLAPLAVTPGASDGRFTEVSGPGLSEGVQVVTRVALPGDAATGGAASGARSPLLQGGQRR